MDGRRARRQRGMTMVIALVVVAVLLFVAVALLASAFGAASAEAAIRAKIAAFDAAEAGINQVVDELDRHHGLTEACGPDRQGQPGGQQLADGGSYVWCIEYNAPMHGGSAKVILGHTAPHAPIDVPHDEIYAWATGTAVGGGRDVTIEALIKASPGLTLPNGALVAGGTIAARGNVGIYASAPGASDADVRANGDIRVVQAPEAVEGNTFAGGLDEMTGADGFRHAFSTVMGLPTSDRIAAAAANARIAASSGSAITFSPTGASLIAGNAYLNGDLILDRGDVVFERGQAVYIAGNVCVRGDGRVVNDGSTIWVAGSISTAGAKSGYGTAPGAAGTLIALGADETRACATASGRYSVVLESRGVDPLGLVYAPNGSIELRGDGTVVGALHAGRDLLLDGDIGSSIQYDPAIVNPVPTYDYRIVSYMEY